MPSWDDIAAAAAAAGEERDALWRSVAEDMEEASGRRGGRGFVQADRPADLARALGRDRRAQAARRPSRAAFSAS
jgi:hypothetical protein